MIIKNKKGKFYLLPLTRKQLDELPRNTWLKYDAHIKIKDDNSLHIKDGQLVMVEFVEIEEEEDAAKTR